MLPPRALLSLRSGLPVIRIADRLGSGKEMGLRVPRGIDEAGDVSGVAEDEGAVAPEQLRCSVAPAPGGEMVGRRSRDVCLDIDPPEVDRRAEHPHRARLDEHVLAEYVQELAV